MPDLSAFAAALSALNAAKDIAQAMIGLRDTATFQAKLLEFQAKLLDANNAAFTAQDERAALLERIGDLEKEVADLEAWEATKQRYELKKTRSGGIAWFLKTEAEGTEIPHQICTKCYEERKRGILQPKPQPSSAAAGFLGSAPTLICLTCKSEILA
jgi:hypothetical protein